MLPRRHVISGGLAAGLGGIVAANSADAAMADADDERVAKAVDTLRISLERQFDGRDAAIRRGIAKVRQQQREFLKAAQKYPDFLEVGIDIWEGLYDWHVRYQQPLNATRLADGRYVLAFMFTNLILRSDQAADYVGPGFDARP